MAETTEYYVENSECFIKYIKYCRWMELVFSSKSNQKVHVHSIVLNCFSPIMEHIV